MEDARREAEAIAERERREAERWAAMHAVPSLEAERAERADAGPTGGPTADPTYPTAGDPFASGVPRRARSGSPAPGAGGGGGRAA